MIFIIALVFTFIIKLRFPKEVSIATNLLSLSLLSSSLRPREEELMGGMGMRGGMLGVGSRALPVLTAVGSRGTPAVVLTALSEGMTGGGVEMRGGLAPPPEEAPPSLSSTAADTAAAAAAAAAGMEEGFLWSV